MLRNLHRHGVTLRDVNLVPNRWYTMLCMPSFVGLVLIAFGIWLMWRASRRGQSTIRSQRGCLVSLLGCLMLYLASTPLVATWLAWTLERQTPFVPLEQIQAADAIVVLAGGQTAYLSEGGESRKFCLHASDRLDRGIEAFKAGKAPLIAMGGGTFDLPQQPLVGDFMRDQAVARGIPAESVLACGHARYTTDEGAEIVRMLREKGVSSIILCTSASHMPRARAVYEALGMRVTPLPCDFDTRGQAERFSPLLLVPRGIALGQTETCLKEWLGLMAGWLWGYR